jgi:hypothetical protein
MLDLRLVSDGHVRHYSIALSGVEGWEVRCEEDRTVCWRERFTDWHRVERMRTRLEHEVSVLMKLGWQLQPLSR